MAYRPHNRYISDEQFSDGTTIDGSRIDGAMQDVVEHINSIPVGDIKTRYTQTQYVMGWSPSIIRADNAEDTKLPWMNAYNDAQQLAYIGATAPGAEFQNPHRAKGYGVNGISPSMPENTAAGYRNGAQYMWTTPLHFGKSAIIKSIEAFFFVDAAYPNDFLFDAGKLPPGNPDRNTRDVSVQMLVDRPPAYGSEDRRLNQILANKREFMVNLAVLTSNTAAPVADMAPTWANAGGLANTMSGRYFDLHLDEPIPKDSRVRLSMLIPSYASLTGDNIDSTGWGAAPWLRQYYSVVITALEELDR